MRNFLYPDSKKPILCNSPEYEERLYYRSGFGKLEKVYKEMDQFGSKRDKLFRNIRHIYLKAKAKYIGDNPSIEKIRKNSDKIIGFVESELLNSLNKDSVDKDDIEVAVVILVVDAFVRCKILEKPLI